MFVAEEPKFQFYKVRLKGQGRMDTPLPSEFQFYKVRLKAVEQLQGVWLMEMFQFYKVRLKASSPCVLRRWWLVSILQSSIKSTRRQSASWRRVPVSILQSSIKRTPLSATARPWNVSILQSSIKSLCFKSEALADYGFNSTKFD